MDYIVFVCATCGNMEIHPNGIDGLSCAKCNGYLNPTGHATRDEYSKYLDETTKCEYCEVAAETSVYGDEAYKYMGSLKDSSNYGMWIFKTNGKWILRSHGRDKLNEVFISHCPKCGRELT